MNNGEADRAMRPSVRVALSSCFFASGAALVIYIISGVSLLAAFSFTLAIALTGGALIWQRIGGAKRVDLLRLLRAGLVAGIAATAAYDLFRYLLIEVAGLTIWPFDVFTLFGQALVGAGQHGLWVTAAGVGFHILNGVGFAIAYTLLFGLKGVWAGIAWAMALEIAMVTVYPGWLGLKALDEFLQVSVFGHFVYGGTLGWLARRLLVQSMTERAGSRPA